MDLNIFKDLTIPIIVISCLIFGYILKNYISLENKHIPLIMALLGIILNIFINGYVSFSSTIVAGALSGLISTGLHQLFSNYISNSAGTDTTDSQNQDDSTKDEDK